MKIYQLSVAILSVIATSTMFSSCASEDLAKNTTFEEETTAPSIVFNIKTPIGDPLVYTRGVADTDEEAKIVSLWMFEIDAATNKLAENPVDLFASGPLTTTSGSSDATYIYTFTDAVARTLTDGNQLARRFVFVANDKPQKAGPADFAAGDDYGDLVAAIATKTFTDPATSTADQSSDIVWNAVNDGTSDVSVLPMSADAVAGGSKVIPIEAKTKTIEATVELTRAVARIDVVNLTPDLEITSMKLMKSNTAGFLIPQYGTDNATPTYAIPASALEASNITVSSRATIENFLNGKFTPIKGGDGNVQQIAGEFVGAKRSQAFYIYEGVPASYDTSAGDADAIEQTAMHLQVYGTLFDGIPVYYNIPFTDKYNKKYSNTDPEYTANEPVTIKRNNVYTVEIGDGYKTAATTNVTMSFSVANWNVQNMTEDIDTEIFKFKDPNTTTYATSYEKDNYVINIPNTTNTTPIEVYVSEDYTNVVITKVEISKGTGWTTGITADAATETSEWLTTLLAADTNGDLKTVNLTTAANPAMVTPAARNISIRISYNIGSDPQTPLVFNLKQEAGDVIVLTNNGIAADDGVYSYTAPNHAISFSNTTNTNPFTIQMTDNDATPNQLDITKVKIDGTEVTSADSWKLATGNDWITTAINASNQLEITVDQNPDSATPAARNCSIEITYGTDNKTLTFNVDQAAGNVAP